MPHELVGLSNRSGWWALIGFVPVIGTIVILVFTVSASDQWENRYGSSPKGAAPIICLAKYLAGLKSPGWFDYL
jgi:hypothetical protein